MLDLKRGNSVALHAINCRKANNKIQVQIRQPGLAVPAQTVLARPAIYRKTLVQSGADLSVYLYDQQVG